MTVTNLPIRVLFDDHILTMFVRRFPDRRRIEVSEVRSLLGSLSPPEVASRRPAVTWAGLLRTWFRRQLALLAISTAVDYAMGWLVHWGRESGSRTP